MFELLLSLFSSFISPRKGSIGSGVSAPDDDSAPGSADDGGLSSGPVSAYSVYYTQ